MQFKPSSLSAHSRTSSSNIINVREISGGNLRRIAGANRFQVVRRVRRCPKRQFLSRLGANKALGTEPLAVASGIKTQAEIWICSVFDLPV